MIEEYGIIEHNENNEIYFTSISLKPKFAHFYGVKAEEKSGKGKSVRLKLVSYEKYN